jgi:putative lipoic acid-binding regulatory protein
MRTGNPEDLLEFPCHYQFKAIGKAGEAFRRDIVRAIARCVEVPADAVRWQDSRNGTYQSVSVVLTIYSYIQLTNIYAEMKQVADLKMLL